KVFLRKFWTSVSADVKSAMQRRFIELWERLPRLYWRFNRTMEERGLISMAGTYRKLAESKQEEDFLNGFSKIIFVGFNALSRSEAIFFKRCQDSGKALFYFDGDR